jgi:hypothetical protein
MKRLTFPEGLAAGAGAVAVLASLAGFIPRLYRDPGLVISQSHGYDVGNLVVVVVLMLGLRASARGSLRGRLVAIGALGCRSTSRPSYIRFEEQRQAPPSLWGICIRSDFKNEGWSPLRDLNPRPLPYQGSALPLS